MKTTAISLLLLAAPAAQSAAQVAATSVEPVRPSPAALLDRCAESLQSSRSWQCQLRFDGVGELAARTPEIRGHALWVRAGTPWSAALEITAQAKLPAMRGNQPPLTQEYRSDGTQIVIDNLEWQLRVTSPASAHAFASLQLDTILPPELRAEVPFADWDRSQLSLDEPATFEGTLCHRLRTGDGHQRLWIAVSTGRPRVFESSLSETGSKQLVLDDLAPVESPGSAHFTAPPRPGWRRRDLSDMVGARPAADQAAVGTVVAPFSLRRPNGTSWRLAATRGDIVVLDFFATWCGPCKLAMPTLQRLSEQFSSRQVQVVGVSTWEAGDPAALYAKLGLDYELLLDGDAVAKRLGVSALPTVLVLDASGHIRARLQGYGADTDRQLRQAVTELLNAH